MLRRLMIVAGVSSAVACQTGKAPEHRREAPNAQQGAADDDLTADGEPSRSDDDAPNAGGEATPTDQGPVPLRYAALTSPATAAEIQDWVSKDQAKRASDKVYFRYAFIPQQFQVDAKEANYARIGLSKAINSVAIAATKIVTPEDVSDGHGVVFALDLRAYWGNKGQEKWNIVAKAVPRNVFSPAPRLDLRPFDGSQPVSADRLAYNLLHGGIYNQLIETPGKGAQLINSLGARDVTARSAVKNAITFSPRYIQRRQLPNGKGAYWESFDDFDGRRSNLTWLDNPVPRFRGDGMLADFGTVASEAWYHMPNGMPAYFIWGNANQERTKAEQSFVIDPLNNRSRDLLTGFCIFCHISGVQGSVNDMARAIADGTVRGDVERAKQIWTAESEMTTQYISDRKIVTDALALIVAGISDGDEAFNAKLADGTDEREPCFFLISGVTGNPLKGDTTGRRHRDADGNLKSLR